MYQIKKALLTLVITAVIVIQFGIPMTVTANINIAEQTTGYEIIRVPADVADLQTAIHTISDGGVIELAAGTYVPPVQGYIANNEDRAITIRAAAGANVVLDGQGNREILRFQRTSIDDGGAITFQGLTFANGYTSVEGTAAAVTIYFAQATFIDCTFENNQANVNTVGGAVYVAEHSRVFFFNTMWINNSSKAGGGALGARGHASVYIHNSQFIENFTNVPYHSAGASGGAINAADSDLYITNTRFDGNIAGAYGGAVYVLGVWEEPVDQMKANVIIVNSSFIANKAQRHPTVIATFPTEGGAINIEDQTLLRIYHSRFVKNDADIGGGINVYRAKLEVYSSEFLGNRAVGTLYNGAFGGTISLNSSDIPSNGDHNWPSASLLIEDSYIQGRYEDVTTVAHTGGCIQVGGDQARIDGDPTIPDLGTVADNRAKAVLRRVVINDCDVHPIEKHASHAGGLLAGIADLTVEDSLILNSDAFGDYGAGGGMAVLMHSVANIEGTTFGYNSSGLFGGGV
ncbi:MAG: hypothetical protein P1S60_19565, partial [Anaerolineae bacterium]|nr:hypothetical protein [Anaerolineae bacterium]